MYKTTLNLAALIAAALLTACGGGSDDAITPADNGNRNAGNVTPTPNNGGNAGTRSGKILVPAPAQPTAAETTSFNISKMRSEKVVFSEIEPTHSYTIKNANGQTLIFATGNRSNPVALKDFRSLPSGFSSSSGTYTEAGVAGSLPVSIRSYQGFRSGVVATYAYNNDPITAIPYGVTTPPAAIPNAGRATYTGPAFDRTGRGSLTYNVDFGARRGAGYIDGFSRYGRITLGESGFEEQQGHHGDTITGINGKGSAANSDSFVYALNFYGDRAEEIAGIAVSDTLEKLGFHGTRGAITE